MSEIWKKKQHQEYQAYVKKVTPVHNLCLNTMKAFLVGGMICVIGQGIINLGLTFGLKEKDAYTWCSILMILLSVIFTAAGWYQPLAKIGGAGTLVPITGFANSVAASAIEYQKEGQVFGIGCKIFIIAGPVILYGIFSSWLLGLLYWFLQIIK